MASQSWVQELSTDLVGPFSAVTAASITALVPDITIPAYTVAVGTCFRALIYGKVTTAASTPGTFTLTANWGGTGGTNLVTSGALSYVASATNIPFKLDYLIKCVAVSNGLATMQAMGEFQTTTAVLATPASAMIPASAPASVGSLDITTAKALNFSITMSAATNSVQVQLYTLETVGI